MPYGSGPVLRSALVYAKPWQRYLIGLAMVAGGVVLVLIGHVAGGLLAVAGVLLLWRMAQFRVARLRAAAHPPVEDGGASGGGA